MSITTEVDELQQLVADLRRSVTSLVATYPDCPEIRRVANDAEHILNGFRRLEIDIDEFAVTPVGAHAPARIIQIPDTQYDHDFWRDVDHEGIGGRRG